METNFTLKQNSKNISEHVKHKILVMSGKGGVGKTTVAVNLANMLSKKGFSVGLLDIDIHGPDVAKMLGLENKRITAENEKILPIKYVDNFKIVSVSFMTDESNKAIIWRGPLKHSLIKQCLEDVKWGNLDFLILDFPPSTGDESISAVQMVSGAKSIIVSSPQELSIFDARKAIDFSVQFNVPVIGIIENMSGDIFGKGTIKKIAEEYNIDFLGNLSLNKEIIDSAQKGEPLSEKAEKAYYEFSYIVENILNDLGEKKK